ncbi:hypothetical protein K431DRAFT_233920 [Polychaeton citri CBS 116435]|uniref:Arylsulfotransferase n=1 Tax=Polychaeton citri CBS 116435 TaxID=1314669 RepID=A0A9P4Q2U7_9PEZI|nr:hypothetical protein K431DRAFT_233920 [Polychaeton citri CBS 116435]
MNPTRWRTSGLTALCILSLAILLLFLHQAIFPLAAWAFPFLESSFYDIAVYGAYPVQDLVSFDLGAPWASLTRWHQSCDSGLVLLSPNGPSVANPGPMILDARGNLVWATAEYGTVMNMKAQTYKGQQYLTFWAGDKQGSMGDGEYYMLDSTYTLSRKVEAVGDSYKGDLHEFIITDDDTALMTVYNKTQFDLTAMGRPVDGWIVDSLFQEVDIETGDLLFEWRASDHFNPTKSFYKNPFGGYGKGNAYDFFHINSIQKDRHGNYLICSRHLHLIANISPAGEVLWALGGSENQFKDLSGGEATDFKWQHDARWVDEENGILSVFDNGGAGPIMADADHTKAKIIQIDIEKMTAKLLHNYISTQKMLSASQGSVQMLPQREGEDHVFVGWGSASAYSEYTKSGDLLCETHVGASWLFWFERVKSYRAIKTFTWVGRPTYPPAAKISGNRVFVSWNGATQVSTWRLEGSKGNSETDDDFEHIDIIPKVEFEESFLLPQSGSHVRYRVAALDAEQRTMKYSNIIGEQDIVSSVPHFWWVTFGICIFTGLAFGVWLFVTKVLRRRKNMLFSWEMYRYSKL